MVSLLDVLRERDDALLEQRRGTLVVVRQTFVGEHRRTCTDTAATWLRLGIAPATVPASPSYAGGFWPEWRRWVKFRPRLSDRSTVAMVKCRGDADR